MRRKGPRSIGSQKRSQTCLRRQEKRRRGGGGTEKQKNLLNGPPHKSHTDRNWGVVPPKIGQIETDPSLESLTLN